MLLSSAEALTLYKLDKYKEQANRDRFVLPLDKDISFFTEIIDKSVNYINEFCDIEI